ncbi:MAG: DUF3341 domain-containing protein [Acetobacteraceae bacterium]|nr:DUF3341 domain-containing protein [Acetobacteraceae bacterium]
MSKSDHMLLAEFRDPETLLSAVRRVRNAGLRDLDAFTPFAVEGLPEALALPRPWLRQIMLGIALAVALGVFIMCWYSSVFGFSLNSGGRPLNSWPVFLVLTFEAAVLAGGLAGFVGFLISCGLPRLNHPIFDARDFDRASQDRFFLAVGDPDAKAAQFAALLDGLGPLSIRELPT